jgi:osmotically-inducible protein OsmY
MFPTQLPKINPDEFSRCEEPRQKTDYGKSLSPNQKTDAAIKAYVDRAIWNDDVLRATEYYEMDVHVKNGVVYLYGHIVSTTNQSRINKALRAIPGLLGIQNNLVLDDKLTHEVAASLGKLEHIHGCKFFTGASHGVISLNGNVSDENVKLLAEKSAASNPNVRAVINNVRVSGTEQELENQPFLQPTIGEIIYFLDGISGAVKQVIINPNNRCVVAMIIQGKFADQRYEFNSLMTNNDEARPLDHLVVVPMNEVRYLTKISGFLYINSTERDRYMEFDPAHFFTPKNGWKAPYPYCPADVLFPVENQEIEYQILEQLPRSPLTIASGEQLLWEQLLADPNLGG